MKTQHHPFVMSLLIAFASIAPFTWSQSSHAQAPTGPRVANAVVSGQLIRAGRTRQGTPRFALLDNHGNMVSHVIPAAGLSLGEYVNKQVGITARSVTKGRDNMPYVLAQQVTLFGATSGANTHPVASVSPASAMASDELTNAIFDAANLDVDVPEFVEETPDVLSSEDLNEFMSFAESPLAPASVNPAMRASAVGVGSQAIGQGAIQRASNHQLVQHEIVGPEIISSGTIMHEGMPIEGPAMSDPMSGGCNGSCGGTCGGTCGDATACLPNDCCPCGPSGRFWVQAEYVLWWTKGMDTPPLVTTSPSNSLPENAGVIGRTGTEVLFGGNEILDDTKNGARFRFGKWCDYCQWIGLEGEYFFISNETDSFSQTSTGAPILARPFFNTNRNGGSQDSELVAFPGVVNGAINVRANSELHSISPRIRMNLSCQNFNPSPADACGGSNGCGGICCQQQGGQRLDFILGYRYLNLQEGLSFQEQLSTIGANPATFNLVDTFDTENEFHGVDIGLSWERYRGPWSLEVTGRVALGNNHEMVQVNGSTNSTAGGVSFSDTGGLLAQTSNIGKYSNDTFVAIPEVDLTLGFQIAPSMRALVGYTFFYWSDVVRPGDQIDTSLNPDLIPPATATNGPQRPQFVFNESNFWAQGLRFGVDYRW